MMTWLFALLGTAAGVLQAAWLGREARRGPRLWSWPVRLVVVAAVLVAGALTGQLLPAAVGWAAGFALAAALAWRRLT